MHKATNNLGNNRSNHPAASNRQDGYSLIEALMALTIMFILTGVAVPSLSTMLRKNEVKVNSGLLNASLKMARNQALASGTMVHVCAMASQDTTICDPRRNYNANWSTGWLVFADLNENNELDAYDNIIQSTLNQGQARIVFNQRGRLRFFPNGSARSAGFYICDPQSNEIIHLRLLHTGRTRSLDQLSEQRKSICAQTEPNRNSQI